MDIIETLNEKIDYVRELQKKENNKIFWAFKIDFKTFLFLLKGFNTLVFFIHVVFSVVIIFTL